MNLKQIKQKKWYHFSIDDCIEGLRKLTSQKPRSIFNIQPFKFIKFLHDEFNTKITLNLFYQTKGFNLSQVLNKYKGEFKKNSDWLKFAPHALDKEHTFASTRTKESFNTVKKIIKEIKRFSSPQNLSFNWRFHFYSSPLELCVKIKKLGVKTIFAAQGNKRIAGCLKASAKKALNKGKGYILDKDSKLLFVKTNFFFEDFPKLNEINEALKRQGFMVMLTHEYLLDKKDMRKKIISFIKKLNKKSYKSLN